MNIIYYIEDRSPDGSRTIFIIKGPWSNKYIPFYQSTGQNSHYPKTFFPFIGIGYRSEYVKPSWNPFLQYVFDNNQLTPNTPSADLSVRLGSVECMILSAVLNGRLGDAHQNTLWAQPVGNEILRLFAKHITNLPDMLERINTRLNRCTFNRLRIINEEDHSNMIGYWLQHLWPEVFGLGSEISIDDDPSYAPPLPRKHKFLHHMLDIVKTKSFDPAHHFTQHALRHADDTVRLERQRSIPFVIYRERCLPYICEAERVVPIGCQRRMASQIRTLGSYDHSKITEDANTMDVWSGTLELSPISDTWNVV